MFLLDKFYWKIKLTRPGVDKVKPKVWFSYSLQIGIFIIIMVQGRLMMFSLNMVKYPLSFASSRFPPGTWDHSEPFLLFEFYVGPLLHA